MRLFTIAVYDFSRSLTGREWASTISELFAPSTDRLVFEIGVSADSMSRRTGPRFFNELVSMQEEFWTSTHALRPEWNEPFDGWCLHASLVRSPIPIIVMSCESELLVSHLSRVAIDLITRNGTPSTYAIAYWREFDLGPEYYAYGLTHTAGRKTVTRQESEQIGAWFRDITNEAPVGQRFRLGWLRDVYAWNVLSRAQLAWSDPAGVTLESQLLSERLGMVRGLSESSVEWRLPPESLEPVRRALRQRGQLIAYV